MQALCIGIVKNTHIKLCNEKYIDKENINKGWKFCRKLIFANISNAWNLELESSGIRSRSWKEVPKDSNDHWILLTILIHAFWYFCLLVLYRWYNWLCCFIISNASFKCTLSHWSVLWMFCVFLCVFQQGYSWSGTVSNDYYSLLPWCYGMMTLFPVLAFWGSFSVDFSRSSFARGVKNICKIACLVS